MELELKIVSQSFAKWYDFFMAPLEQRKFKGIRKELLNNARGKVLEIGSGTGINFPYYVAAESVTAIEPSEYMIEQSHSKKKLSSVPLEVVNANAGQLPFEDDTFDTIVATLVLCTIPDVDKALKEIKRVCKPEGTILVFEHVKMDDRFLAALQGLLTPFWKRICDGCCLNRDTITCLKMNGFSFIKMRKYYKGLFIVAELKVGE